MSSLENLDKVWLAGEPVSGTGEAFENTNPYNGETLFELKLAGSQQVDEACEKAAQAQVEWAKTPPATRSAQMLEFAEAIKAHKSEMVDWVVNEIGGTRAKAELELMLAETTFREAAPLPYMMEGRILPENTPGKESRAYRKPVGVIGLISPWNVPVQRTARSLAPALALGNAVVLKPATDSLVTGGTLFGALAKEVGLPAGLLSVLPGRGSDIGDHLVKHRIPRVISFTGSTKVGRQIGKAAMEAEIMKRVELELGGNCPLIVLDDADIDQAVKAAVWGKFMHCGQICMAVNRILVQDGVYEEFRDKFVDKVRSLRVGDPSDPETFIGPIINSDQFDNITSLISKACDEGARCCLDGESEGLVIPPHVFEVDEDSVLSNTEIFGPVAPLLKVTDDEHAIALANATDYGLSSSVFTADFRRGLKIAQAIEAGVTHINDQTVHDSAFAHSEERKTRVLVDSTGDGLWTPSLATIGSVCSTRKENIPSVLLDFYFRINRVYPKVSSGVKLMDIKQLGAQW